MEAAPSIRDTDKALTPEPNMQQVLSVCRTGSITAANTSANQGPDVPGRLFVLKAKSTNTGTITKLGYRSAADKDTVGPVYALGDAIPVMAIDNLNRLAFQFSVSGEILFYEAWT